MLPNTAKQHQEVDRVVLEPEIDVPQYAYIIGVSREGPVAIGAASDPYRVLDDLNAAGVARFNLYWVFPCPSSAAALPIISTILQAHRLSDKWFDCPIETAMGALWIASQAEADDDLADWCTHIGLNMPQRAPAFTATAVSDPPAKPAFDRKAYQREYMKGYITEYMRQRRAQAKDTAQ